MGVQIQNTGENSYEHTAVVILTEVVVRHFQSLCEGNAAGNDELEHSFR